MLTPSQETAPRPTSEARAEPLTDEPLGEDVDVAIGGALHTAHLRLVPATAAHLAAGLAGGDALADLLGAAIPASWPPEQYDAEAQQLFLDCLNEDGAEGVGWYGWYAIRRADAECGATVVAAGGFVGPPKDADGVELWFSVCPEWRGRGYAGEIVRMLADHAAWQYGGTAVIAHTMPENPHALRVLTRCGFAPAGTAADTGALRLVYRPDLLAPCGCGEGTAARAPRM